MWRFNVPIPHRKPVFRAQSGRLYSGEPSIACDSESGQYRAGKDERAVRRNGRSRHPSCLYRKINNSGSECLHTRHSLSDNRYGLIASAMVTKAAGYAEREAAKDDQRCAPAAELIGSGKSRQARIRGSLRDCVFLCGQRSGMLAASFSQTDLIKYRAAIR